MTPFFSETKTNAFFFLQFYSRAHRGLYFPLTLIIGRNLPVRTSTTLTVHQTGQNDTEMHVKPGKRM